MNYEDMLNRARHLHQQGQLAQAQAGYRQVLLADPGNFAALHLLGVVVHQQGCHDQALRWINRALAVDPHAPEAWANHGVVLLAQGMAREALASFDRSLRFAPDCADTLSGRADALCSLGRLEEAIEQYDRVLRLDSSHLNSWNNRGNCLQRAGREQEALESFNQALTLNPSFSQAWDNLGTLLRRLGRSAEALACHANAIAAKPEWADSWNRQAAALLDLYRYKEAIGSADRALSLSPGFADALVNSGLGWLGGGNPAEALARFEQALSVQPELPEPSYLCGVALQQLGRHDDAIAAFRQALAKNPGHRFALGGLANAALHLCDWELAATLKVRLQTIGSDASVVAPLVMQGYFDAPDLLQRAARIGCPAPRAQSARRALLSDRPKIRLAYISGDFCEHATAYLTAGLFESHDRARFEVFGISYGVNDGSAMRRRLAKAFDRFFDVSQDGDGAVAQGLRDFDVDILIDLKGHTRGARTAILAHRPAPIQVNFLGYPGTMGAPYIDYIVADATVLPRRQQPWYDEAIVHLPCCYQPQDRLPAPSSAPSREGLGLPPNAFVFCCFNNHWKLTQSVFDVWLDLLRSVAGSVLWLLVDSAAARQRLCGYALSKGVDPGRVVFAQRASHEAHLARHAAADLFLDTWPYGAHTTASDALRANLPLITMRGRCFQARVAASLLHTLNLEEWICPSPEHYRSLALRLAKDCAALRVAREKLQANLSSAGLLPADSYCRYLEAAFVHMHDVYKKGGGPHPFTVTREHHIRAAATSDYLKDR